MTGNACAYVSGIKRSIPSFTLKIVPLLDSTKHLVFTSQGNRTVAIIQQRIFTSLMLNLHTAAFSAPFCTHIFCFNAKSQSTALFNTLITAIKFNLVLTRHITQQKCRQHEELGPSFPFPGDDSSTVTATWWTAIERHIPISETLKHGVIKCVLESIYLWYVQTEKRVYKWNFKKVLLFNHFCIVECVMTSVYYF